ncbi:his Kinase A domain protein [Lyngbya aestuarii BL J]|uniref:histidine kinase n=1 Tax=Lyngbya aestuarii BL J TaxID=1348334 RepID=U7QNI3_9CYAN|nr:ATP-binding protein [Lyngbya aestuarii]ERT08847.1 his Kinase A domain protein [Lyngbya aestuarii BL J]
MSEIKVLIVEDELLIAKGLARKLQKLGYTVVGIVSFGDKALEQVRETQPDLVLMDIVIKGEMDGIETAEKINECFNIPVIYVTAYADDSTLERAEQTGSYGYILKPYKDRELHATIKLALRKHQTQLEMQKNLANVQLSKEEKSRLLSIASHDLRTPLSAIQMSSDLLENYDQKLTSEKKIKHFQRIKSAIKNMNQLLEDVLMLSLTESGKMVLQPAPLNLKQYGSDLIDNFQVLLTEKHQLEFNCNCNSDQDIMLDEKLLNHILGNLLSNAIKYSPEGGTIHFDLIQESQKVIFRVGDEGIGLPPEYKAKLFQSFERAANVGDIKGTGLGLSIVKQAVDLHRGEISVESEVGKGTTFTVTIPVLESSENLS